MREKTEETDAPEVVEARREALRAKAVIGDGEGVELDAEKAKQEALGGVSEETMDKTAREIQCFRLAAFDVNIDELEVKEWLRPDADPSDYFNYGMGEDTWRQYRRPAADSETVAAGAARGDGPGGRARTARRITQAGAARASHIADADHGRAAAALGRWAHATTKCVPAAWLSRCGPRVGQVACLLLRFLQRVPSTTQNLPFARHRPVRADFTTCSVEWPPGVAPWRTTRCFSTARCAGVSSAAGLPAARRVPRRAVRAPAAPAPAPGALENGRGRAAVPAAATAGTEGVTIFTVAMLRC